MVKRSLTQQSDNNPKTKYSNGKTLENFPFLIHLAPKRLFRQHALLDLLDLVTEHFVCLHQVRNRLAGMEYRRMVLSSDRSPDNSQRRFRMLFAQVHRDLARLCDLTRTTRRLELLLRQSQVFTHHFLNVIDRNLLLRKLYVHFQYLLGQRDRNLFAEERCIRHQRRESSLYLTDIRIDIIGQEIDHLVRHIGPETKRFVTDNLDLPGPATATAPTTPI